MKECKKCGQLTDRYYSKKHKTCISCLRIERKYKPSPLLKKKILEYRIYSTKFILNGSGYSRLLGCKNSEIRIHIEKQFKPGMSWESHGGWHIDHIVPLNSAKDERELYELLKWQNIQPLWAEANLRKTDGVIDQSKLDEINEKMAERYERARESFESGIVKTKTTDEMLELLKDFSVGSMSDLEKYAGSIGYDREGDLFIKKRKL